MLHKAQFGSHRLHLRYHPAFQERPYAFYHMTHKGNIEDERLPDLRRCERMPWARPTVERTESLGLRFWEQSERRNGRRICIWLDVDNGDDYFVILYVHRRYVRLLTAFYGDSPNYAKKRLKEYEDWKEKVGRDFTPDELVSDIISRMPAVFLSYPAIPGICLPEAQPKNLFSPHKVPVIRAPGPRRIRRALLLPLHLL